MKTRFLAGAVLLVAALDIGLMASARYRTAHVAPAPEPSKAISGVDKVEQPITLPGEPAPHDHPVIFRIEKTQAIGNSIVWNATYTDNGHTALFRLAFEAPAAGSDPKRFPIATGSGHVFAVAGSDPSTLLSALAKELWAKKLPSHTAHQPSLAFTYATLAENATKTDSDGFVQSPAGSWIAMKIFVGAETEEDEGEFFLNLNPSTGQGEFSRKDPDYGDVVLRHLATVL